MSEMSDNSNPDNLILHTTYLVIGGGIAGVSCAQNLSFLCPNESIILVTLSPVVKSVTNVVKLSSNLESFEVKEVLPAEITNSFPNIKIIQSEVTKLDSTNHEILTLDKHRITYKKLCICSGAFPNIFEKENDYVLGIRDTETVNNFQRRIKDAKRIVILGNGGIATELVYEIDSCEIVWVIKDTSIGATFFDAGAAQFFYHHITDKKSDVKETYKRLKYQSSDFVKDNYSGHGSALGPDWGSGINFDGCGNHRIHIEYNSTIDTITNYDQLQENNILETNIFHHEEPLDDWPVYATLSSGKVIGCNFIVSATGVVPLIQCFIKDNDFDIAEDGGFTVDNKMRTSIADIYSAGDSCTASWVNADHWFQMRLWTQARQMGHYSAKCMAADIKNEDITMDFCFEMFTHVTKFFNFKVILLGLYNGQGLPKDDMELLVRITKGKEYVKTVMKDGRMQGAVLIGDTDLEETFENLILNQMDLSIYGENLLNPDIDIEDYFD